jgi:hypothetical protein
MLVVAEVMVADNSAEELQMLELMYIYSYPF